MIAQLLVAPALDVLDEISSRRLKVRDMRSCLSLLKPNYFAKLLGKQAPTPFAWLDSTSLQQHHASVGGMVCDILNVLQIARVLSLEESEAQVMSTTINNYGF